MYSMDLFMYKQCPYVRYPGIQYCIKYMIFYAVQYIYGIYLAVISRRLESIILSIESVCYYRLQNIIVVYTYSVIVTLRRVRVKL
jgi:hypothetical protein